MTSERIQIVEDDALIATHAQQMLVDLGYDAPEPVARAEEAVQIALGGAADLFLMDIRLAGDMSGIEAAQFIVESTETPVVYLTAYSDADLIEDACDTGPYGYLVKPLRVESLRAAVKVALSKQQLNLRLKENERRFRSLAESAPTVIIRWDHAGRHIYDNPAALRLMDVAAMNVTGRTDSELNVPLQVCEEWETARTNAVRTGEAQNGQTKWNKSGHGIVLDWHLMPEMDETGEIASLLIMAHDITRRVEEEARRMEAQRLFLQEQKTESLATLAAGIAHDFNNRLMVVLGNCDLVLEELEPDSRHRPFLEDCLESARQAADLSRAMLTYSGHGRFFLEDLDLNMILGGVAQRFALTLHRGVGLTLDLQTPMPTLRADAQNIRQAATNLLSNAAEALGDEPGTISIETGVDDYGPEDLQESYIKPTPAPGRFAWLEVCDTGCGMDEQTLERLFDPFYTNKFIGRGLGMSAMLGIVRGHSGAILVDSESGKGTTVRVLFPVQRKPAQTTSAHVAKAPTDTTNRTAVLVLDDEEPVLRLCEKMLARLGRMALNAPDGEAALQLLREHIDEVAMVLMDLRMPGTDSRATFQSMRLLRPDLPVIIASGSNERIALAEFGPGETAGYIQKPYSLKTLKTVLERVGQNQSVPPPEKA